MIISYINYSYLHLSEMKKLLCLTALGMAFISSCNSGKDTKAVADTNDDVILHAWSWSFDTIGANMKDMQLRIYLCADFTG